MVDGLEHGPHADGANGMAHHGSWHGRIAAWMATWPHGRHGTIAPVA